MTLPQGWAWTTVGDCAQTITGTTPSKADASNYGDYLPLVKPPELTNSVIEDAEDKLSEKGVTLARVLPPESVLVSCIGILGKTGINRVPVAFNQQINAVIFPAEILPKYGFYYFQTSEAKEWLHSVASATTVTIVNKSKFEKLPFPLAPLPEQRCIVAEIEKQFTRLDAGVAALKRAQANLKRYKASMLKAACEGKLVPQDPNDESASKLLARTLEQRRKGAVTAPQHEPAPPDTDGLSELPRGWCWVSLPQIGELARGKSKHRPRNEKKLFGGPYPFIQTGEIRQANSVITVRAQDIANTFERSFYSDEGSGHR